MKPTKSLLVVLLTAVTLAGCAAKPSLVGSWTGPGSATYTFLPTARFTLKQHIGYGPISGEYDSGGTYTLAGNRLTMTSTSRTVSLDPATQQALSQRMQAMHPGFPALPIQQPRTVQVAPTSQVFTVTFKDANTAELAGTGPGSAAGHPIELVRAQGSPSPASAP